MSLLRVVHHNSRNLHIRLLFLAFFSDKIQITFYDYANVNKYPDFRKYAKNIGDKLGLDKTFNDEMGTDLNAVPSRLLMKDDKDTPKYLPSKNAASSDIGKVEKSPIPKLIVISGKRQNVSEAHPNVLRIHSNITEIHPNELGIHPNVFEMDPKNTQETSKETERFDALEELDKQALEELSGKIPNKTDVKPVHIVIVTNRRSGSSFLGQIFNQNPNVFFHFEPLKLTEWKKELYPNATKLITNIFKCRFDATPFLMEMYNHESLHRESSKVLITPPLCNLSSIVNRHNPVNFCPRLTNDVTMDVCRRYRHVVVKTIRMYSVSALEEIVHNPDLNVKVIHLMRDPRGIYISRTKAEKKTLSLGSDLDQDVSYICRRMRKNLEFVKSAPMWLDGRYLRVRYEEVAENPRIWTQKLYNFTGLGTVPDDVIKWIDKNTQATFNLNAYSTQRDSASTSQAWRKTPSIEVVQQMQSLCHSVLLDLGYLEVNNVDELRNTSLSLVV
ncbi:carbohydrate sulfotransferase 1-like [Amphiura filiformis]|uniref:carbohydrate sulfotransferase 1-like n=1 Tax=Amphiura filiformis TaxID=82378 RepID=UPI003B223574